MDIGHLLIYNHSYTTSSVELTKLISKDIIYRRIFQVFRGGGVLQYVRDEHKNITAINCNQCNASHIDNFEPIFNSCYNVVTGCLTKTKQRKRNKMMMTLKEAKYAQKKKKVAEKEGYRKRRRGSQGDVGKGHTFEGTRNVMAYLILVKILIFLWYDMHTDITNDQDRDDGDGDGSSNGDGNGDGDGNSDGDGDGNSYEDGDGDDGDGD
eukprot:Pgem_evm1s18902